MITLTVRNNKITLETERAISYIELEKKKDNAVVCIATVMDKKASVTTRFELDLVLLETGRLHSYPIKNFQAFGYNCEENNTLKKFYENSLQLSYKEFREEFLTEFSERVEFEARRILR